MKIKKLLFYLLATLLAGCIPVMSLHPLYTDKDLIFDEKLLGTWPEGNDSWKFEEGSDPNSYALTVTSDDKKGKFIAHLVKIDDMLFLDLFPSGPDLDINLLLAIHLLPVHTFMKVEQVEPTLQMQMMDPDKIEEMLKSDPNLIKHEIVEERILLTASTEELQQFMTEHADDEGLFGEPSDLQRLQPKDANKPNSIDPNEG